MDKSLTSTGPSDSSHSRSKTLQHLPSSSEFTNASSRPTAIANDHRFELVEPTTSDQSAASTQEENLITAPIAESSNFHQRNLSDRIRSPSNLPPESESTGLGIVLSPTKAESDFLLDTMALLPENWPSSLPSAVVQPIPKPTLASRFSFFASKAPTPQPTPLSDESGNEFLHTDVRSMFMPAGYAGPFTAAAFKALQRQAESLLLRLQAAYRKQADLLRSMAADRDAQAAALREMTATKESFRERALLAEVRANEIQRQWDAMAKTYEGQDRAMMDLVDELAKEKLARVTRLHQQDTPPPTRDGSTVGSPEVWNPPEMRPEKTALELENARLRERVAELEEVVAGTLEMVAAI